MDNFCDSANGGIIDPRAFNQDLQSATISLMRQCVISCDSDERALKYVVEDLRGENIVWNTDYPHPDAIDPKRALPDLDAQPIPDEAKCKILWDNAIKLFGPRILN